MDQFSRTELLLGAGAMQRLAKANVAVFGLGGVGSYCAEALARTGVGSFTLVDDDCVCLTNINRQLIANIKTVGKKKTQVMRENILNINPRANVQMRDCFYTPQNADEFDLS
ncbi:MAG: ThiF family adenylyltransferase, partial [Eubacteriales bacterium]